VRHDGELFLLGVKNAGGFLSTNHFSAKVKRIIGKNFDQSIERYQVFEDKHHFFSTLTLKLAEVIGIEPNSSILDVGCGYGLSATVLNERLGCQVVGVDLSPKMIAAGKVLYEASDIRLVVGDGENLCDSVQERDFDYVLYNASIFLFPDVKKTICEAYNCLRAGGKIAFSFYPQLVDSRTADLFDVAFRRLGEHPPTFRVITDYPQATAALHQCCGHIRRHQWIRPLDIEFLQDFFSIPAQSASLFPGRGYDERRRLATQLFAILEDFVDSGRIVWRMAEATRL